MAVYELIWGDNQLTDLRQIAQEIVFSDPWEIETMVNSPSFITLTRRGGVDDLAPMRKQ